MGGSRLASGEGLAFPDGQRNRIEDYLRVGRCFILVVSLYVLVLTWRGGGLKQLWTRTSLTLSRSPSALIVLQFSIPASSSPLLISLLPKTPPIFASRDSSLYFFDIPSQLFHIVPSTRSSGSLGPAGREEILS